MINILITALDNIALSKLAASIACSFNIPGLKLYCYGNKGADIEPYSRSYCELSGLDSKCGEILFKGSLAKVEIDLIISLGASDQENVPNALCTPVVFWNILKQIDLETVIDYKKFVERLSESIKINMKSLFQSGYLTALVSYKNRYEMILDNLSDAILAHDMNRKIFYFNSSCEELTGLKREDVIGRDCHDVFPSKFCGHQCSFDGETPCIEECSKKVIQLETGGGAVKLLNMVVRPLIDKGDDNPKGVVAVLDEITTSYRFNDKGNCLEEFPDIVGVNSKMLDLLSLVKDVAPSSAPVTIHGETGTGKELIARAIHDKSNRSKKNFVPVNCGAIPENLLESELFGHVKGAFTGAIRDKKGRFEIADGGTIFLDEIGDISPAMQVKLLRVLQEGTFEPVGSEKTIKVDVRVVSATHKDLRVEIVKGNFRQDLYYRIGVVPLLIVPLRERRSDIPLLADYFLSRTYYVGVRQVSLSQEAADVMLEYEWPGNIRELENWIQFALVKCKGKEIRPEHLPNFKGKSIMATHMPSIVKTSKRRTKLQAHLVLEALQKSKGNKLKAAKLLGVGRATLYRFIDDNKDIFE